MTTYPGEKSMDPASQVVTGTLRCAYNNLLAVVTPALADLAAEKAEFGVHASPIDER